MLEEKVEYGNLYDFYGNLLNDSQKRTARLYYMEDLSLQEIGDELNISRQAVFDSLKRARKNLDESESKLGLLKRFEENKEAFKLISNRLKGLEELGDLNSSQKESLKEIYELISDIIESD